MYIRGQVKRSREKKGPVKRSRAVLGQSQAVKIDFRRSRILTPVADGPTESTGVTAPCTAKSGRLNQNWYHWYRPEPEWNRSESECVYRSVSVQMGNDMYQSVGIFLYQSDTILIQSVFSLYQR